MKEKIKKIYKSDYFPFVIYAIILIIIHLEFKKYGDDIMFSSACNNTDILNYIQMRYLTWSSRVIIEFILVIFGYIPMWIWKIANIGMFILLAYSISTIFIKKNKRKMNYILVTLLLMLPLSMLISAGWMATMNNYLWVVACGLYAMIPIKKIIEEKRITVLESISYILALIYACNQEQMAIIIFLVYSLFIFYNIVILKKRKINNLIFTIWFLSILSLLFILTCPGNYVRTEKEILARYPEFKQVDITGKIINGLTSMMKFINFSYRILFIIFVSTIGFYIIKKYKDLKFKILGITPIILTIGYTMCYQIINQNVIRILQVISNIFNIDLSLLNIDSIIMFSSIFLKLLIMTSISIVLYILFNKEKIQTNNLIKRQRIEELLPLGIFLIGFISRFIIGFSPTVYASSERTSTFFYVSLITIIIYTINKFEKDEKNLNNIFKIYGILMIINWATMI